jgi:hypothetical protein
MDNLTNECQQIAMEVFAQNGAKNNASTMAAAQLIGEAFSKKIREREANSGDSLSRGRALDRIRAIMPEYQESSAGVFEDIWCILRQDSFLFRSINLILDVTADKDKRVAAVLKSLTTWSLAWLQYKGKV